ncbi:MAG: purple acid phosphatase family protein, partial [Methylobacter sp.]
MTTKLLVRYGFLLIGIISLSLGLQVGTATAATFELLKSAASNRSNPGPLANATVAGENIYVFVAPDAGISPPVSFYLDTPTTGTPRQVENTAPWDLAGGTPAAANPFNTGSLTAGAHTLIAKLTLSTGSEVVISATFMVNNQTTGSQAPDQVHLAWLEDPSTTLTVIWKTLNTATPSTVEYQAATETIWHTATGKLRTSGTKGTLHEVTLTSLKPSTTYKYRVPGDNFTWSPIFTTRTAPPPGPADFMAIFVADTGIVGRLDGLATGTQQVVDEIVKLNPLLVLLGEDYVSFVTDRRFGTIENTIDAWFNQMQPIGAQSPMMPTYGNHENDSTEGILSWQNRFATPSGFDNRKNYSFDVGNVHFL